MTMSYVLITPARNEVSYIEATIRAVTAQTHLPKRWVIVSDGSTDGTDEIVRKYMQGRDWLELLHLPEKQDRSFAAKVRVFNAGYARLKDLEYDVIGNLDADITFETDYFSYLMEKFASTEKLGVAGTHYIEGDFHSYNDSYMNLDHVNGGCQLFRKACFEDIGGYVPIKGGGIDWVAVTTARMKGWQTRSFAERVFNHHRKIGTAEANELVSRFRYGKKDYFLGGHPLWELLRGGFQMVKKPYLIGGMCLLSGYFWSWLTGHERPVSKELVTFHRQEQVQRLRQLILGRLHLGR